MKIHPAIKSAICRLWGHNLVFAPTALEFIEGGQSTICRRCGKEHFQTFSSESFPDLAQNSARESMINFAHMNKHQRISQQMRS